jgi:outer membrane protein assembly factor BamA
MFLVAAVATLATRPARADEATAGPTATATPTANPDDAEIPSTAPGAPGAPKTGPRTLATRYSPYELYSIREAKRALKTEIDFEPEGKFIERVEMLRLEVIEERDPVSDVMGILNFFHTTTRPYVVRRELLQRQGDRWQQTLVDETARNLRGLPQLSLVVIVPMKGSAPDRVIMTVITKDVWSLRLNINVSASSYGIESFSILPSETNVAGSHNRVSGSFGYNPAAYSLGAAFSIPRLQDTRVALAGSAGVILNHYSPRTSGAEGSYASFAAGQPLYSSKTEWAWSTSVEYTRTIARSISRADIASFGVPASAGQPATPPDQRIPYEYRSSEFASSYGITRSFGWENKHNFSLAYEVSVRDYAQLDPTRYDDVPRPRDPRAVALFAQFIPASDTRSAPILKYQTYTTNFLRIIDFATLGLQEDYRLGHNFEAQVYPVLRALGSSRSFFGTSAAAQYTIPVGRDGFLRGGVVSVAEFEPGRTTPSGAPAATDVSDASIGGSLTFVTPRFFFGRVVFDVDALNRYENFLRSRSSLGGSGRLRGYPTSFMRGESFAAGNVEIRTRPVDLVSVLVGLAAFYDVGAAFDGSFAGLNNAQLGTSGLLHGVGAGLRTLFPQLDRFVFRADFAVPLRRIVDPATGRLVDPFAVHVAFGQAF